MNRRTSTILRQDGKNKDQALKHTGSRWNVYIVLTVFSCADFDTIKGKRVWKRVWKRGWKRVEKNNQ